MYIYETERHQLITSFEMCYNVDDILPLCEELNLPLVVSPTALDLSQN